MSFWPSWTGLLTISPCLPPPCVYSHLFEALPCPVRPVLLPPWAHRYPWKVAVNLRGRGKETQTRSLQLLVIRKRRDSSGLWGSPSWVHGGNWTPLPSHRGVSAATEGECLDSCSGRVSHGPTGARGVGTAESCLSDGDLVFGASDKLKREWELDSYQQLPLLDQLPGLCVLFIYSNVAILFWQLCCQAQILFSCLHAINFLEISRRGWKCRLFVTTGNTHSWSSVNCGLFFWMCVKAGK